MYKKCVNKFRQNTQEKRKQEADIEKTDTKTLSKIYTKDQIGYHT